MKQLIPWFKSIGLVTALVIAVKLIGDYLISAGIAENLFDAYVSTVFTLVMTIMVIVAIRFILFED
jgi:hypothetical protein